MITDALETKGVEFVKRNIRYTNSKDFRNYPKYLRMVLEKDFGRELYHEAGQILSKRGLKIQSEMNTVNDEIERQNLEVERLIAKEAEQEQLLKTLTKAQFTELTKQAIKSLHPFDAKRYKHAKDKINFGPVVRNRLAMVENFLKSGR